jgi:hypothetical protein
MGLVQVPSVVFKKAFESRQHGEAPMVPSQKGFKDTLKD